MARAHIMSKTGLLAFLLILALSAAHAFADDYAEARAEMLGAYQQADFAAMREAAGKALAARPGFPGPDPCSRAPRSVADALLCAGIGSSSGSARPRRRRA